MAWFWQAFWPNLASTVVGALFGIPLGLWINRRIVAHGESLRREGERLRVAHALQVLGKSLTDNRLRLQTFGRVLAENRTLYDTEMDTSAWDAVKSDLTTELSDPELRQRLAYHFSRLDTLVELNDEYLHFIIGVGASMSSAPEAKKALGALLTNVVTQLDAEASELGALSTKERLRLLGKGDGASVMPA